MGKRRLLFSINQFFKGGAETALLNLFRALPPEKYEIDFLIFDQIDLKGSLSLIPQIPDWIHVINVGEREKLFAYVKKVYFRIYRDLTQKQLFRRSVRRYLKDRSYDVAISFGEWFSCAPIATMVRATRKYVWIHADMEKAVFLHPDIISCQQFIDQFFFVSEHSRQGAVVRYPFLEGRSVVIHNLVDEAELLKKSREPVQFPFAPDGLPLLVTVANIRPEKNHLRQIEAMKLLREEGLRFRWLNIGSHANWEQTELVARAAREAGLEADFLLMGASENPYSYMKAADAVCVFSDHESWSMVITEAKALGVPVIATRTSGALEQIKNAEDGVLCDFSAEDIAAKIKAFLIAHPHISHDQRNAKCFSGCKDVLGQVEPFLDDDRKKLLFLFDDVNYMSGARRAALGQLELLREHADVSLFSTEPCRDEALSAKYRIIDLEGNRAFRALSTPFGQVWRQKEFSWRIKLLRGAYAIFARIHKDNVIYDRLLGRELACFLSGYDVICVLSEASKLRAFVSTLEGPQKVQWIHTDYAAWRGFSPWTRAITKHDGEIYRCYDKVVLLSERIRERFVRIYPYLAEKTVVIPNLIDYETIVRLAQEPDTVAVDKGRYNLITIGRMEAEKRYDRLLVVATELRRRGIDFHWHFVGDGSLFPEIQAQRRVLGLGGTVILTGALENPYPLLARCDLFVLFSEYEGTPVTIDEAKALGVPVLAADIGGIADQLGNGKYGTAILPDTVQFADEIAAAIQNHSLPHMLTKAECQTYNGAIAEKLKEFVAHMKCC